jgi:hypothetical protein
MYGVPLYVMSEELGCSQDTPDGGAATVIGFHFIVDLMRRVQTRLFSYGLVTGQKKSLGKARQADRDFRIDGSGQLSHAGSSGAVVTPYGLSVDKQAADRNKVLWSKMDPWIAK